MIISTIFLLFKCFNCNSNLCIGSTIFFFCNSLQHFVIFFIQDRQLGGIGGGSHGQLEEPETDQEESQVPGADHGCDERGPPVDNHRIERQLHPPQIAR